MQSEFDKVQETKKHLVDRVGSIQDIAIVLGTGLGNFATKLEVEHRIPYIDIPHFPPATVKGHAGELIFGQISGKRVVAQSGRYHYYEGYSMKEVTFPIRVFKALGVRTLIIASAVGGIHADYQAGDISVVCDHINFHNEHPLNGPNDERLGPRFPDMINAYDPGLIEACKKIALENKITLHESVYAGLPGPNIETKAEYRFLHIIGATVVGMSTVPEVIVAKHMDLKTCVLTAITNKCYPIEEIGIVTHDEVIRVAQETESKISLVVNELIGRL